MKTYSDFISEEGYDHYRDRALEKGTWKEPERKNPPRSDQKPKGKTVLQRETEKKYGKGKSAMDIVKKRIEQKYGKGATALDIVRAKIKKGDL